MAGMTGWLSRGLVRLVEARSRLSRGMVEGDVVAVRRGWRLGTVRRGIGVSSSLGAWCAVVGD